MPLCSIRYIELLFAECEMVSSSTEVFATTNDSGFEDYQHSFMYFIGDSTVTKTDRDAGKTLSISLFL